MSRSDSAAPPLPVVIVGTGLAGYGVARELRKRSPTVPLHLLSADEGCFYAKPMLSNALSRGRQPDQLVDTDATRMAERLRARVRAGTWVTGFEPDHRRLRIGEERLRYGALVLALGAEPMRLTLRGNATDRVFSVNDLADYRRFRRALEGARRVGILGAGLIGCEFADDLRAVGHQVDVVDLAAWPLARLVPEAVGRILESALAGNGVRWHWGAGAVAVERSEAGVQLTLTNGERLQVDLVLSAVGLRPRTRLAAEAGLEVDRGIVVDRFLRTGAESVYALGDCAQVEGLVLPFVMPIMHAARALARTLTGMPAPVTYPAMPVVVKTPTCPLVVCPAPTGVAGDWETSAAGPGAKALFRDQDGRLRGFALTGEAVGEKGLLAARLAPWLGQA